MKDTSVLGYGFRAGEGIPVFVIRAELFGDHDRDGEFDLKLAVIKHDGVAKFAVITYPGGIHAWEYSPAIGELLAALIKYEQFIAAIDTQGRDYDLPGGFSPLFNVDFDEDFDQLQYRELDDEVTILKDMKEVLDGARVGRF